MTDIQLTLLADARKVLERYLFDDIGICRDDVAIICEKIDDVLPAPTAPPRRGCHSDTCGD